MHENICITKENKQRNFDENNQKEKCIEKYKKKFHESKFRAIKTKSS